MAVDVGELAGYEQLSVRGDIEIPDRPVERGREGADPVTGLAVEGSQIALRLLAGPLVHLDLGELAADEDPIIPLGERQHRGVEGWLAVPCLQDADHAGLQGLRVGGEER